MFAGHPLVSLFGRINSELDGACRNEADLQRREAEVGNIYCSPSNCRTLLDLGGILLTVFLVLLFFLKKNKTGHMILNNPVSLK